MGEAVAKCLGLCRAAEAATVPVKVTAGQAVHLNHIARSGPPCREEEITEAKIGTFNS